MEEKVTPEVPEKSDVKPEPVIKKSALNGWKVQLALLAVIIIVGAIVVVIAKKNTTPNVTPTPQVVAPTEAQNPTTVPITRKTYTNTKYGYSFMYPSDWTVLGTASDATFGLVPSGATDAAISVDVSNMVQDDRGVVSFAEYAKTAARNEIQNYTSLSTIKEITTTSGLVGYETTWKVVSMPGAGGGSSVSDPMTYFPVPAKYGTGMLTKRLQIAAVTDYAKYKSVYDAVLLSLKFL